MKTTSQNVTLRQLFNLVKKSRISVFVSSVVYAVSLIYCLSSYAAVEWSMYGFSFEGVSLLDAAFLSCTILLWSLVLPKRIDRPSSLFLIVIYLFVCIPGAVVMVSVEPPPEGSYYLLLSSLSIAFFLSCIGVRAFSRQPWLNVPRECSSIFLTFLIFAWAILFGVLIFSFGSIMTFAAHDDIYLQRERGSAGNIIEGYLQTYFGYVISPILLALGLANKRYLMIAAGLCGGLVLYMISAEKAVLMFPLFIITLFLILRSNKQSMTFVSSIAIVFSVLLFLSVFFFADSAVANFIAWYLGVRSLLIPGFFITCYSNYFNEYGYTFFSHIRGIGQIVDAPAVFASNPKWPSIGHLIGEDYLGIPTLNANANFIASDGVASLGTVGIFVVLMLFTCVLVVLDRCSRGVRPEVLLPMLVPLALTLTNASIFTAMTSFGGLFLLWFLYFGFKKSRYTL